MGTTPTTPPPGATPATAGAVAGLWRRFRSWPLVAQIVLWAVLWPALLALLLLSWLILDLDGDPSTPVGIDHELTAARRDAMEQRMDRIRRDRTGGGFGR